MYSGWMAEHRITLTLGGVIGADLCEALLDRFLSAAPDTGSVVGWTGSQTDVTLAVDATDATSAVAQVIGLVERALERFPGARIVGAIARPA